MPLPFRLRNPDASPAPLWLGVLCVSFAALLYHRVWSFGFCNLDDFDYVLFNPLMRPGLGIREVLRMLAVPTSETYWSPVTQLSLYLDHRAFGTWAGGYHLVNAGLHCINVGLFFWLAHRLTGRSMAALWAALLFAAHPVHVEAVAWISARKDMLSTCFGLLAVHGYLSWVADQRPLRSLAMHGAYALSLMAKPMLATLAGLLLLLDFWPLGRLHGPSGLREWAGVLVLRLREKALLFALGLLAAAMTIATHYQGYDRLDPGLGLKISNALVSYAKYLGMYFHPAGLAVFYPFPDAVPFWQALASAGLLAVISLACALQASRRPYLLVGWLWFLVSLLPVIIPPKVGMHVELADRWAYVPYLGLHLALACLGAELVSALGRPAVRAGVAALWLCVPSGAAAWVQQQQLATWTDASSINEQAIRVTRGNYMILANQGVLKLGRGEFAAAEALFQEALRVYPGYSLALFNLGALRVKQGAYGEALGYFLLARDEDAKQRHAYLAYCAAAYCLGRLGRVAEATQNYVLAIKEEPNKARAYAGFADLAAAAGEKDLARRLYEQALTVEPGYAEALEGLRLLGQNAGL